MDDPQELDSVFLKYGLFVHYQQGHRSQRLTLGFPNLDMRISPNRPTMHSFPPELSARPSLTSYTPGEEVLLFLYRYLGVFPDCLVRHLDERYRRTAAQTIDLFSPHVPHANRPAQITVPTWKIGPPSILYVDFAVWGPFGHRISKKMKMVGLVMGPKGELHQTECFGPSTFSDWEQSFRVFRTGCMMLEAISSSALDQYHDLILR